MSDDIAIRPENPPVLSARREQNSSPDSPDALVSLAREKIKDGIHEESDGDYNNGREELNEADQLLNQAIQKVTESKNPKKALILAALWMEKGDLEVLRHNDLDGKDCWEKVPHILEGFIPDPEDNFAHTLLYAQVLTRLGEEEKTVTAIRALRFLAETDPDIKSQISKREMVCEYFLGAGKTEEAAKELQIAFDLAKKLSGEEAETVYWELYSRLEKILAFAQASKILIEAVGPQNAGQMVFRLAGYAVSIALNPLSGLAGLVNAIIRKVKRDKQSGEMIERIVVFGAMLARIEQQMLSDSTDSPGRLIIAAKIEKAVSDQLIAKAKETAEKEVGSKEPAKKIVSVAKAKGEAAVAKVKIWFDRLEKEIKSAEIAKDPERLRNAVEVCLMSYALFDRDDDKTKLAELRRTAESALIDVYKEKKNYTALLYLANNPQTYGTLSLTAWDALYDLVLDDPSADMLHLVEQIGEMIGRLDSFQGPALSIREKLKLKAEVFQHTAAKLILKEIEAADGDKFNREMDRVGRLMREMLLIGKPESALEICQRLAEIGKKRGLKELAALAVGAAGFLAWSTGNTEQAAASLTEAEKLLPENGFAIENKYLSGEAKPSDLMFESKALDPLRVRAMVKFISLWRAAGENPASLLSEALIDLGESTNKRYRVTEFEGQEALIDVVRFDLPATFNGNTKTLSEVLLKELGYRGLKEGTEVNPEEVQKALEFIAKKRLKSFVVETWQVIDENGKARLNVKIKELPPYAAGLKFGFATNDGFAVGLKLQWNNMGGRGKKMGLELGYQHIDVSALWDGSLKQGSTWKKLGTHLEGNVYYEDPSLFMLGKDLPVTGRFSVGRQSYVDYAKGGLIWSESAQARFSTYIREDTELSLTPSFSVFHSDHTDTVYRLGLNLGVDHNRLETYRKEGHFPVSGYRVAGFIGPSVNFTNDARWVSLALGGDSSVVIPLHKKSGISLYIRGRFNFAFNALKSEWPTLGNYLDPYVRGFKGDELGMGALGLTVEIRGPIIGDEAQIQPYIFADAGLSVISTSPIIGISAGAGVRIWLPGISEVTGVINLYTNFLLLPFYAFEPISLLLDPLLQGEL